jgi:CRISPR-associated protein Cmr5
MQTREQEYAAKCFDQVTEYKKNHDKQETDQYGSMAHQLPVLVRSAGLAQALTFVCARGKSSHKQLLDHLAETIKQGSGEDLAAAARSADLPAYMRLTQQVLAALVWYKRFAQSVLDVTQPQEGG